MKITIILFLALAFSCATYAQTEKIAHRSHSGKNSTFRYTGYNNFGATPSMIEEQRKRDSAFRARPDSIKKKAEFDSLYNKPATPKTKKTPASKNKKVKSAKTR